MSVEPIHGDLPPLEDIVPAVVKGGGKDEKEVSYGKSGLRPGKNFVVDFTNPKPKQNIVGKQPQEEKKQEEDSVDLENAQGVRQGQTAPGMMNALDPVLQAYMKVSFLPPTFLLSLLLSRRIPR